MELTKGNNGEMKLQGTCPGAENHSRIRTQVSGKQTVISHIKDTSLSDWTMKLYFAELYKCEDAVQLVGY